MRCPRHPRFEARGTCAVCERFVCARDAIEVGETLYCRDCAPRARDAFSGKKTRVTAPPDKRRRGFGARKTFRSFEAARRFARRLGLKSGREWRDYVRGRLKKKPRRPADIPADPASYPGWVSMGDWLGTGRIDPRKLHRMYLSFAKARELARSLGLETWAEWRLYTRGRMPSKGKLPVDVPAHPYRVYAEWVDVSDWLGSRVVPPRKRNFRSFKEARAYARTLGIRTYEKWVRFARGVDRGRSKLPTDIPAAPWSAYKKQWIGISDWLGTGKLTPKEQMRRWLPFHAARKIARSLGLRTKKEWHAYVKGKKPRLGPVPEGLPLAPWRYPRFTTIGDWLGTGQLSNRQKKERRRTFAAARKFARSLGLKNKQEWLAFARGNMPGKGRLPQDIPVQPWQTYRILGTWTNLRDWLGPSFSGSRGDFLPFEEARAWARTSGIGDYDEWIERTSGRLKGKKGDLPPEIPATPWSVYPREWKGMGDWLGTFRISNVEKHRRRMAKKTRKPRTRR